MPVSMVFNEPFDNFHELRRNWTLLLIRASENEWEKLWHHSNHIIKRNKFTRFHFFATKFWAVTKWKIISIWLSFDFVE